MLKKNYVKFSVLSLILISTLAGCGCKKKEEIKVEEPKTEVKKVEVVPYEKPTNASPITGLACNNYNKRPFAVMYSGDSETRPYFSNINKADMVVEMDHRSMHGGTRVMGIFQCETPTQIGPMRSGRVDFLTVADSLGAVFVPWGGDITLKSLLNKKIVNSLTCADGGNVASSSACYRIEKSVIPLDLEDRAFTSVTELINSAEKYGYSKESTFEGFQHQGEMARDKRIVYGRLSVGYDNPFRVHYEYNPETNSYERFFNNQEEFDFVTKERVAPKNVVIIQTKKQLLSTKDYDGELSDLWNGVNEGERKRDNDQYANFELGDPWFDIKFEGEAKFYMNGQEILGTWKREKGLNKPFKFYDASGEEIRFVPGQIWLEVIALGKTVRWNEGDLEDKEEAKKNREEKLNGTDKKEEAEDKEEKKTEEVKENSTI